MNVRSNNTTQHAVKKFIKRSLQYFAALFGRHTRVSKEPQLLILMYHRVLPGDDPRAQREEPGMMVTPETFALHLNVLKQYFTIVKLADWIKLKQAGENLPKKACAITFDDGWIDNYEYAFPVLKNLNVSATIFLVADMIGSKQLFWPERLANIMTAVTAHYPQYWSHEALSWLQKNPNLYRLNKAPPTSEEISALIASLKIYPDQEIHDKLSQIETILQLDKDNQTTDKQAASLLNWEQVNEMIDSGLVDVGSHTCHHTRLNQNTSNSLIEDEIVNSKKIIKKHTGQPVETFCYPNGDHCKEAIKQVAQNYTAAVTTQFGWNTPNKNIHLLKRVGLHQDISADKTAFLARISGWM
ncbi:hypothetical protein MNBD_GAMMA06-585 [hydrothermal vent metagenome]|uniref:NodB homology domain-containing protein n=1 Tax=hydrothermal vent metagenome TaxID=652676 RepID=A0A3B0XFL0_9ZZZZ